MERYVDGFLLPIAKDKVNEYREMAQKSGEIWRELGALEYYECVGDDRDVEDMVSFKKAANASEDETVIFHGSFLNLRNIETGERGNHERPKD